MRRFSAAAFALLLGAAPAAAAAQTVTAPLGQAVRLPLRGPAADVVVGDPKIADVTVVSPTALFVSGRGFGVTNLVVLDVLGRTLFNGRILVPAVDPGQITVQRGRESRAVFCAATCDLPRGEAAPSASPEAASIPAPAAAPVPPSVSAPAATISALIRDGA